MVLVPAFPGSRAVASQPSASTNDSEHEGGACAGSRCERVRARGMPRMAPFHRVLSLRGRRLHQGQCGEAYSSGTHLRGSWQAVIRADHAREQPVAAIESSSKREPRPYSSAFFELPIGSAGQTAWSIERSFSSALESALARIRWSGQAHFNTWGLVRSFLRGKKKKATDWWPFFTQL